MSFWSAILFVTLLDATGGSTIPAAIETSAYTGISTSTSARASISSTTASTASIITTTAITRNPSSRAETTETVHSTSKATATDSGVGVSSSSATAGIAVGVAGFLLLLIAGGIFLLYRRGCLKKEKVDRVKQRLSGWVGTTSGQGAGRRKSSTTWHAKEEVEPPKDDSEDGQTNPVTTTEDKEEKIKQDQALYVNDSFLKKNQSSNGTPRHISSIDPSRNVLHSLDSTRNTFAGQKTVTFQDATQEDRWKSLPSKNGPAPTTDENYMDMQGPFSTTDNPREDQEYVPVEVHANEGGLQEDSWYSSPRSLETNETKSGSLGQDQDGENTLEAEPMPIACSLVPPSSVGYVNTTGVFVSANTPVTPTKIDPVDGTYGGDEIEGVNEDLYMVPRSNKPVGTYGGDEIEGDSEDLYNVPRSNKPVGTYGGDEIVGGSEDLYNVPRSNKPVGTYGGDEIEGGSEDLYMVPRSNKPVEYETSKWGDNDHFEDNGDDGDEGDENIYKVPKSLPVRRQPPPIPGAVSHTAGVRQYFDPVTEYPYEEEEVDIDTGEEGLYSAPKSNMPVIPRRD